MIEETCAYLRSLDDFKDISPRHVRIETMQTLAHSEVYRVRIDDPPTRLILKRSGPSDDAGLADRERLFYRHIAPLLPRWLVPESVLITDDAGPKGRLFIEDLSNTHKPAPDGSPTRLQCRSFVKSLATLHASTANNSDIRNTWAHSAGHLPAATISQRLSYFQLVLGPFIEMVRHRVDDKVHTFLSDLADLQKRIEPITARDVVLIHGDAHFANALFAPAAPACLIDWGMPMIGFGEIDLAHALALNLPPHARRTWEEDLVDVYLEQRALRGVDTDRVTFYERYKHGVLYSFVSPVVWWQSGVPEPQWWSALNNSLHAARDLGLLAG